jgi:DNA polymerase IV
MYDRAILHMDLDSFFVSVECLKNSKFLGLPLIIGGTSNRGVVSSCSYEARQFGVHSGMPVKMAMRLCPQALIVKGDMDSYSKYSHLVTDIVAEESPMYEKASIDEFYLDLSGMDKHFGCYKWSIELRNKIMRESGLPISFGLSINKLVSKVGTNEAKPNGTKLVEPGIEKEFLAPLSVSKIPGVGKETHKKLVFMGVRDIRTLSKIPVNLLMREFGVTGRTLSEKSNAIDKSPVVPYSEQKSMSKERTFTEDTLDLRMIRSLLLDMTDKLAFELRNDKKLTSCVAVKIRYADFNTFSKQRNITYTASDSVLTKHVTDLFDQLYERRQLIRLIGVKFSGLVGGSYQIDMFEDTLEQLELLKQIDHIRKRWGSGAIGRASAINR